MPENRNWLLALWCALTIFVSAFLLFQVQPLISKMILPWFGGSPAVWTTCMLFFQVLLLGGYAYAHFLNRLNRPTWQTVIHVALISVAVFTLRITPDNSWRPEGSEQPTVRILLLLTVSVGLPYFILSSTGPLIQAWYASAFVGRSPYRLYALSNIGSLGALLSYPFVFEPAFSTTEQGKFWSIGFFIFAALCGGLALIVWRIQSQAMSDIEPDLESKPAGDERPPSRFRMLAWLLLPAFASMSLLAATNHVCQDVAVIPFLWVAPLSLYLLTFIICFDREIWYQRRWVALLATAAMLVLCVFIQEEAIEKLLSLLRIEFEMPELDFNILLEVTMFLGVMFLICMVCHGELVRLKPAPRHLTKFYLFVSAGGALGGVFVALICPVIFTAYYETQVMIIGGVLLAVIVLVDDARRTWAADQILVVRASIGLAFSLTLFVAVSQLSTIETGMMAAKRNFYGVLQVNEFDDDDPKEYRRNLYHGRILHGTQFMDPSQQSIATTYYRNKSGVGLAMQYYAKKERPLRVAVVGLGVGTMAAHGRAGDFYRFYDINPQVIQLNKKYFRFLDNLRERPADVKIIPGDARISMDDQEDPQRYDVIVLDAFSGDAIPVHLLTKEAFDIYLRHLNKSEGVIAVHISNRHIDLRPVVARLAEHFEMDWLVIDIGKSEKTAMSGSNWVLVTNNKSLLADESIRDAGEKDAGKVKVPLWTDQYSNLFQILD